MSFQVGGQVGAYQIQEVLGVGGMATVYRADQPRLGRSVAIKVMHAHIANDPGFIARFEREARIVAKLDHPNIVPVYDYDEVENQPYLVMKYIEGETLKAVMQSTPLTLTQIADVLTPIAHALTYAHTQDILHRDIKPSNILMDERNIPYITDFGLARIARTGQSTMSADVMLGTPHYISPEQAQGQNNLDARTDVYSLGVVLYEMVTGRTPFIGDTSYAIIHDQIYTAPPPAREIKPDVPEAVETVLNRALKKAPDDRYDTPDALIAAYRQAIHATEAIPPSRLIEDDFRTTDGRITPSRRPDTSTRKQASAPASPQAPPSPVEIIGDARRSIREARHEFRDNMREARKELKQGFGGPIDPDHQNWKSGARWTKSPDGVQGFYTDEEVEAMEGQQYEGLTDEQRIRKQIEKRIEERNGLLIHLSAFVIVNFFLFMVWLFPAIDAGTFTFPWFLFPLGGWGIGMFAHWMDYYTQYGGGREKREARIEEEVAREMERRGYGEKPKHKNEDYNAVRLTEDGEMSASFVERYFDDNEDYQQR